MVLRRPKEDSNMMGMPEEGSSTMGMSEEDPRMMGMPLGDSHMPDMSTADKRWSRRRWLLILGAAILLAIAWYLGSPLFLSQTVHGAFPMSADAAHAVFSTAELTAP